MNRFQEEKKALFVWELSTKSDALSKHTNVRSSWKSCSVLIPSFHWQFFGFFVSPFFKRRWCNSGQYIHLLSHKSQAENFFTALFQQPRHIDGCILLPQVDISFAPEQMHSLANSTVTLGLLPDLATCKEANSKHNYQ